MSKGLKAEKSKCTGCQVCALVCSATHVGSFKPSESRIKVKDKFPEPADFDFSYCIQCDEHPCVEACPAEAIKLDEALTYAKKAVELNPAPNFIFTLASIYYEKKMYLNAEKEIKKAIEMEPENEDYQAFLSKISER